MGTPSKTVAHGRLRPRLKRFLHSPQKRKDENASEFAEAAAEAGGAIGRGESAKADASRKELALEIASRIRAEKGD